MTRITGPRHTLGVVIASDPPSENPVNQWLLSTITPGTRRALNSLGDVGECVVGVVRLPYRLGEITVLIGDRVKRGSEVLRAAGPAGIIAFERLLPPPIPRLRPYVWSQEKAEKPATGRLRQWGALIVGPKGSLPHGEEVREK